MSSKSRAVSSKGVEEFRPYVTRASSGNREFDLRGQHRSKDTSNRNGH